MTMPRTRSNPFGRPTCESLEQRTLFSTALTWKTVGPMPVPRAEGASFVADGKFYCFGGFASASTLAISNEMDAYDPATNAWARVADCPVKVNDCPVTVDPVTDTAWMGGFFLNDGFHASGLVYAYHVQTDAWTQGPSLPVNVGAGQMGVVGRELYYFGGRSASNVGAVATYKLNLDDTSAGWVTDTPMLYTANHDGAVVLNNRIYAIGGIVDKEETTSNENYVQVFDPGTDRWTLAAAMPIGLGHIASAITVADGDIIVAGGQVDGNGQVMSNKVLQYDPTTNAWTYLTNLPDYRVSSFVGYLDGQIIVTGGNMYASPYINTVTWSAAYSNTVVVLPTVSIGGATAQQGNDVVFTATLASAATADVTASYSLTPGTAPATDFDAADGSVTFTAGSTQATISISTTSNPIDADEQFTLTLSGLSPNASFADGQATAIATGTITPAAVVTPPPVNPPPVDPPPVDPPPVDPPPVNPPPVDPPPITAPVLLDTATVLSISATTVVVGQSDRLLVQVSTVNGTVTPTGTVTIQEDGTDIGTYALDAVGQTLITLPAIAAVTNTEFIAEYSGDGTYNSSSSNLVSQTVLPAMSTESTIAKAIVPATAVAGQRLNARVPVVLKNTGPTETGKFSETLFADTIATGLTNQAVALRTIVRKVTLRQGRSIALPFSIKLLPASLAPGDYYLVAQITDAAGNSSLITTAQSITVAAPQVALSAAFGQSKAITLKPGQRGVLDVWMTNTGNITASGILTVQITATDSTGTSVDIQLKPTAVHAAIKAGATIHYHAGIRIPKSAAAGDIYPAVTVSLSGETMTATATIPVSVS